MGLGNHFDEPVQNRLVGLGESARMRRENLQQADHPEIRHDGSGHERPYSQSATDFRIDTRILFRVLARDERAAANAFSRQAVFCVYGGSQRRSWLSRSRPGDYTFLREKNPGPPA